MPIVDLSDSAYGELKGFREQLRALAQGQKITDEMAIVEAISIDVDMIKDDSFLEGYTEEMRGRLKDFQ